MAEFVRFLLRNVYT